MRGPVMKQTNKQTQSSRVLLEMLVTQSSSPTPLWNLKVYYRVHKSPQLVPITSHMHPAHTFPQHYPKTHSNYYPSTYV